VIVWGSHGTTTCSCTVVTLAEDKAEQSALDVSAWCTRKDLPVYAREKSGGPQNWTIVDVLAKRKIPHWDSDPGQASLILEHWNGMVILNEWGRKAHRKVSYSDHWQDKGWCDLYISLRYILSQFMDNQNFQDGDLENRLLCKLKMMKPCRERAKLKVKKKIR
jgi:hypothetical protein